MFMLSPSLCLFTFLVLLFIFLASFASAPKIIVLNISAICYWIDNNSHIKIALFQFTCYVYKQNIICIKSYMYADPNARIHHKTKYPMWMTIISVGKLNKHSNSKFQKQHVKQWRSGQTKLNRNEIKRGCGAFCRALSTHEWIYRYSVFVAFRQTEKKAANMHE